MPSHQLAHVLDGIVVKLQSSENRLRQWNSRDLVVVKVICSILVHSVCGWLAYIVEKRRPSHGDVSSYILNRLNGVYTHIVSVILVVLWLLHHLVKFRKDICSDPCNIGLEQLVRVI